MSKQRHTEVHSVDTSNANDVAAATLADGRPFAIRLQPNRITRLYAFGTGEVLVRMPLRYRCKQCQTTIAETETYEQAGYAPVFVLTFHRETGRVVDGHPEIRYHRAILNPQVNEVINLWFAGQKCLVPTEFALSCRSHGAKIMRTDSVVAAVASARLANRQQVTLDADAKATNISV